MKYPFGNTLFCKLIKKYSKSFKKVHVDNVSRNPKLFKNLLFCVLIYICAVHVCGGQNITDLVWALRIKLRWPGLCSNLFHPVNYLLSPCCGLLNKKPTLPLNFLVSCWPGRPHRPPKQCQFSWVSM